MGLDMYLYADEYVSGYTFYSEEKQEQYKNVVKAVNLGMLADPETPSAHVSVTVAYWRKQNAIHKWFVNTVQGGRDECQKSYVERDQLAALADLCDEVIADPSKAEELLPTTSGFFFGGIGYDDWYFDGLRYTSERIKYLLAQPESEGISFYYESSW